MKKNRRILGRVLAAEISNSDLHKVTAAMAEAEEGGGDTVLVHHTGTDHSDCHIDGHDTAA